MILKNAWRNIWRNKRRTLITIGSGFFAVFFAVIMRSVQLGSYDKMIGDVVNSYTGYLQIHDKEYWNDKVIENTFVRDTLLEQQVMQVKYVNAVVPRLESFALASHLNKTKGALVIGIHPETENKMVNLSEKLRAGSMISTAEDGALVAEGLAKYLKLGVGDTLVLLGQGYQGMSAAGKYPVRGLLYFPSAELNGRMIYLSLASAQELYSAYDRLTSLSISIDEPIHLRLVEKKVAKLVDAQKYGIMMWDEMLVELVQMIQMDNMGGIIMLAILYIIIGFGILGTVVMMATERMREFAILVALGTHKSVLSLIVSVETLFLGIFSVITGALGALPIIWYFHLHPIPLTGVAAQSMLAYGLEPVVPFALRWDFFLNQAYVILAIILISLIYPWAKIAYLSVVKEIKH